MTSIDTSYVDPRSIISMHELSSSEAQTLFTNIHPNEPLKHVKDLLSCIPLYPLDVSLAAFYMKNTHTSVKRYIQHRKNFTQSFDCTEKEILGQVNSYDATRYGVIATSLHEILKENPAFSPMIFLIFFMESQDLPLSFFKRFLSPLEAKKCEKMLKQYGLITHEIQKNDQSLFSIHRKTQSLGCYFLKKYISNPHKIQIFETLLNTLKKLPEFSEKVRSFYDMNRILPVKKRILWLPHLQKILNTLAHHNLPETLHSTIKTYLTMTIGFTFKHAHYDQRASFYFVKLFQDKSLQIPPILYGISAMTAYRTFYNLGRSDKGIPFLEACVRCMPQLSQHPLVYSEILTNLGVAYTENNRHLDAVPLYKKALHVLKDQENTQLSAEVYGKWSGAYRYFEDSHYQKEAQSLAQKALSLLQTPKYIQDTPRETSYHIAKQKGRLAQAYLGTGDTKHAHTALEEAQYLIRKGPWEDSHLQAEVLMCQGIHDLLTRAPTALKMLTQSIDLATINLGPQAHCVWYGKAVRSSVYIQEHLYKKAIQDIQDILPLMRTKTFPLAQKIMAVLLYNQAYIAHKENHTDVRALYTTFFDYIRTTCLTYLPAHIHSLLSLHHIQKISTENMHQYSQRILHALLSSTLRCIFLTREKVGSP